MALVYQKLTLEVTPGMIPPVLHVTEYDINMQIDVTFTQRGQPFEVPSGTTAKVEGTLAGHPFRENCTVNGNTVTFILSENMTAYAGRAWTKIVLTKDSWPVSTCGFWLDCDRAGVEAGAVIGSSGFQEQINEGVAAYFDNDPPFFELPEGGEPGQTLVSDGHGNAVWGNVGSSYSLIQKSKFYGGKANFLGDSITANTPDPNNTYFLWVKKILGLETVRNYGVSGSSFADNNVQVQQGNISFCDRYASMDNDADLIVVFGGANDIWHGSVMGNDGDTTTATVWGALHVLCTGLIAKYPTKTIVFVTTTKQDHVTGNMTADQIANAVKTTCARFAIPVFDANAETGIYPKNDANASYYTRDDLHLNANGHKRLGEMLGFWILSRFGYTLELDSDEYIPDVPGGDVPSTENISFDEYSWTRGGYYGRNGTLVNDNNYYYSEHIDISKYGGKGMISVYSKEGAAGCIFASGGTLLLAMVMDAIETEQTWDMPSGASYMILNYGTRRGKDGCYWRFTAN